MKTSPKNSLENLRKTFANNILSTQEMKQVTGRGYWQCLEEISGGCVRMEWVPEIGDPRVPDTDSSEPCAGCTPPIIPPSGGGGGGYTPTCSSDMPYVCGGYCSELPC